jgi:hypothetical protein
MRNGRPVDVPIDVPVDVPLDAPVDAPVDVSLDAEPAKATAWIMRFTCNKKPTDS